LIFLAEILPIEAIRTTVYGPVPTVVWEGEGCEAFPYPDLAMNFSRRRIASLKRSTE
jgi:hypothetical protein